MYLQGNKIDFLDEFISLLFFVVFGVVLLGFSLVA